MKIFNANGSIKRDNSEDQIFGWIWRDLSEDRLLKMTVYNSDGSVRSEEYYDEFNDWEIVTSIEEKTRNEENKTEAVNTIKWYQRTVSNVQEENRAKLSNLLLKLNNRESHLLLAIVSSAIFNSLMNTKTRKPETTLNLPIYSDINNDVAKTLRLKKLHQRFNMNFNFQLLRTRYNSIRENSFATEVNKYIEEYLEIVDDSKQILFWDFYLQPELAKEDASSEGIGIDKCKKPFADIDRTLLKLFDKTCEMHCEVEKIRKCFLVYEDKMKSLINECTNIRQDIFETKYLDNIILILNNEIEDLDHNLPFKIVVDVYSDWCGPCAAMSANLKKLKLEIGGDNLHLAMAKSDNIECLKRFREKSEPTWMFVANGKMINLMFGANAPKLTRLIIEELKREEAIREGTKARHEMDLLELAPEEQVRFEASEKDRLEGEEVEREVRLKAKDERLHLVVDCMLQTFATTGVLVIFPYAIDKISLLHEIWEPNDIKAGHIEKMSFKHINVDDMLYFTEYRFPERILELATEGTCTCYMIKMENPEENVDNVVLNAVYGTSQQPPGSVDSFAIKMRTMVKIPEKTNEDEEVEEAEPEEEELDGVWVPPNANTRALAIYMLFPNQALPHVPPEPEPIPPHIAVAYDAFKRTEVMGLIEEYKRDVMRFGFFTDEKPETAKLIAKTVVHFEKKAEETTYGERMIVQLSKKYSDTVLAFAQLGPTYMSPNAVEGERECKMFFPKGYDVPEVEEAEPTVKKKSKRKSKKVVPQLEEAEKPIPSEEEAGEPREAFIEGEEAGEGKDFAPEMMEGEETESMAEYEEGEEVGEEMPEEVDKATSPMEDGMGAQSVSDIGSPHTEGTPTEPSTAPEPPTE